MPRYDHTPIAASVKIKKIKPMIDPTLPTDRQDKLRRAKLAAAELIASGRAQKIGCSETKDHPHAE